MFDRRMRASYAPYVTSGCCPSSTSRCILRSRDATLLCEFVIDMQSKSDTISNLKVIRYSVCGTAIFDDGSPMAPQLISRSRTASFEPCHCMCIGYFKAEEASEACVLSKIGCCMVNLNQREEAHKRIWHGVNVNPANDSLWGGLFLQFAIKYQSKCFFFFFGLTLPGSGDLRVVLVELLQVLERRAHPGRLLLGRRRRLAHEHRHHGRLDGQTRKGRKGVSLPLNENKLEVCRQKRFARSHCSKSY